MPPSGVASCARASQVIAATKWGSCSAAPRRSIVAQLHGVTDKLPPVFAADRVDLHSAARVTAGARAVAVRRDRGGGVGRGIGGNRCRLARRMDVTVIGGGEAPGEVAPQVE